MTGTEELIKRLQVWIDDVDDEGKHFPSWQFLSDDLEDVISYLEELDKRIDGLELERFHGRYP